MMEVEQKYTRCIKTLQSWGCSTTKWMRCIIPPWQYQLTPLLIEFVWEVNDLKNSQQMQSIFKLEIMLAGWLVVWLYGSPCNRYAAAATSIYIYLHIYTIFLVWSEGWAAT